MCSRNSETTVNVNVPTVINKYNYFMADISTTPGWFQEISLNHPGVVARDLLEPPPYTYIQGY